MFQLLWIKWERYKHLKRETGAKNFYGFWLDERLTKKNSSFTVPIGRTIFLTWEKIIVCTPDFLALHKHLPYSRFSFHTCVSKCLFTFNKPCSHQEAAFAQPTIPSLALMEGYHSKHQVMNLCTMANLLNQKLSWRYLRFTEQHHTFF